MAIQPWEGAFPSFCIMGNLYFVGTTPASTHVVDTGDGLLMFDSGYQHSLYLVLDGMYRLGLDPRRLAYILHSHGHIDHLGATRALVALTGAKTIIGRADREYANGRLDLTFARELGMEYNEAFEPDILWEDGDSLTLGNTTVSCVATPGHTPGALSYFFPVSNGGKTYRAGLHGGMGLNSMTRSFLDKYGLSLSCRDDFKQAMDRLCEEPVDIYLGNHMNQNQTPERYQRLLDGDGEAFVDSKAWALAARKAKENLIAMEVREQAGGGL